MLDENIDLKEEKEFYYNINLETFRTEVLIDMYVKKLPRFLGRILYNDFVTNTNINKIEIKEYSKKDLEKIIKFNPDYKLAYIYKLNETKEIQKMLNKINEIPKFRNVWLPEDVFVKDGAIKVNFEYLEKETKIRYLTNEEVDTIIDRDFRLVNGLYKYLEYSNSKSGIMLTRDEIFKLISKKYIYARLAFKFKIEYDYTKILFFKKT